MAIAYYGVSLSPNWVETPEGFIIFKNAVIGRTGFQTYKGKELDSDELKEQGIAVGDEDDVHLFRDPEEVFSPKTLASFEGKSVTDGHPSELLSLENVRDHEQGQVINVRQGSEPLDSGDLPLLADLIVKSKTLIDKIKAGLRELSCGYNYHVLKDGDVIKQTDIIGNHVAIVESARAGHEAAIGDSIQPTAEIAVEPAGRIDTTMAIPILAVFDQLLNKNRKTKIAAWVKDAKPEEVAEMLDTISLELEKKAPVMNDVTPAQPLPPAGGADGKDSAEGRKRFHDALDRVLDGKEEEEEAADADVSALADLFKKTGGADVAADEGEDQEEGEDEGEEEEEEKKEGKDNVGAGAMTIEPADRPDPLGPGTDAKDELREARKQAVRNVLRLLKPIVAASHDKKLIHAFDTASKMAIGKSTGKTSGGYGAVATAAVKRGKEARDSMEAGDIQQLNLKRIADAEKLYRERFNKRAKVID